MFAVSSIGGFLLLTSAAVGQTFEAASIKPSTAEPGSGSAINTVRGRVSAQNVTLRRCIRGAYDIPESRILGGPKWVDEDRYDIEAKAAGPAGDHELMAMLQATLAERFHLVIHRETRQLPGYALVRGKGGLKAKASDPNAGSKGMSRRGGIDAEACTMNQLAMKLSEALHLPVADMTGIKGRFDFKLEWTPDDGVKASTDAGPSIFAALQEQLGLRLEARKVPTEVIVIDRAEKASEN